MIDLSGRRALFFDLDDTLLDHRGAVRAAVRDMHEGLPWFFRTLDFGQVFAAWSAISDAIWEEYSRGLLTSDQLKLQRTQRLIDWVVAMLGDDAGMHAPTLRDFYLHRYEIHCALFDGVMPMLQDLRLRYAIGIITNGFASVQSRKLTGTRLADVLDHVIVSEEVGVHKPDAAIFRIALEAAGVEASEAVYVGDNYLWDVRGAAHAGLAAVWYNPIGAARPAEYADVDPVAVVRSVPEMAALFGSPI